MPEHCSSSQNREPVKRKRGLSRDEVCLKFQGFECNCRFSNEEIRKEELRKLRQQLGAYSFINLLDPGLAEAYETRRKELCEGQPPNFLERLKNFRIRII